MFSRSMKAASSAVRLLFSRRKTLLLLTTVYAALLISAYFLVSTREATITQLIVTLTLAVVVPALFFYLQSASINYAAGDSRLLGQKLAVDLGKLVVVSLPVLVLTVLSLYGLGKLQTHFGIAAPETYGQLAQPATHKGLILVTALRYLLIGAIAPLLAIQLWIGASRNGLFAVARQLHRVAAEAFAPESVFVYGCGFLVFAVIPYFALFRAIPTNRAWVEISLLVLRLLLGAVAALLGWVMTVGALSILSLQNNQRATAQE